MYDSPRRADPSPKYSPEGDRYYAALNDVDYAADLAKNSYGVPDDTLMNLRQWAADESIDASRYYTPDTPRRGNPNLSSGQFGAPSSGWDERSKVINTPGRPYISEEDDEAYRANFGDDYYKDGNLGHSTKNWT